MLPIFSQDGRLSVMITLSVPTAIGKPRSVLIFFSVGGAPEHTRIAKLPLHAQNGAF